MNFKMITVLEARKLIRENCISSKVEEVKLRDAYGFVLAENVHAKIDTPPFNQSAMDGYAFSYDNWDKKSKLNVVGEIQAGNFSNSKVNLMEAVRIYTGAALPFGTDTVVMQEKVIVTNNLIAISDIYLEKGTNMRFQGSQGKNGEVAMHEGSLLTPSAISFLAGTGIDKVKVYSKPIVSIIVTGKELVQPGSPIANGEIFECNSYGLVAGLNQLNIQPVSVEVVDDVEKEIIQAISNQLRSDILILTGGISVGEFDFVSSALDKCGVRKIFHKVKQKPGKPFYFGKFNQTLIFGLPGNPAAVMTCFYEYIVPAISSFNKRSYFKNLQLPLTIDYKKKAGLTFFLKGKIKDNEVMLLNNQESYLMDSFAIADCIIELDEDIECLKQGELVNISMII